MAIKEKPGAKDSWAILIPRGVGGVTVHDRPRMASNPGMAFRGWKVVNASFWSKLWVTETLLAAQLFFRLPASSQLRKEYHF